MREAVEQIVKALVSEPSAVEVSEVEGRNGVKIEVRVAPQDMGKLIGKGGRTVRSIRSLLHAAGVKQGRRFVLDIVE